MKLRSAPRDVLSSLQNLSSAFPNGIVPPAELREFLDANFENPGTEFEPWTPSDWQDKPKFLNGVADDELRKWGGFITCGRIWAESGVKDHPEHFSQIYTLYPVVVPGGRFREVYYRDSYWVINRLLLSEMTNTTHGMILELPLPRRQVELIQLLESYGFVPNGGRVYYERRSQPPFLPLMVESYYKATKDKEFLREALLVLEKEYQIWTQNCSVDVEVNGSDHVLNRYRVQAGLPRLESYADDLELAEGLANELKEQLWTDLKAGAESGRDFASRWYINADEHGAETRTSLVLTSDLSALLCRGEKTPASLHRLLGGSRRNR